MKVHLLILSIACFSCLVPPAMSHLLAAKVAAVGAAKGLAVLAAKGALVKGAALLAAKGAAVKGAAVLGAKAALVGGAAYLAKKAAYKGAALVAAKAAAVHGLAANGAAVLAAKAAAVKGAALLAKGAALKGASLLAAKGAHLVGTGLAVKGALAHHLYPPHFYKPHLIGVETYPALQAIPPVPPQFPAVLAERLSGLYDIAADSVSKQAEAVNELGAALQNKYSAPYPYQKSVDLAPVLESPKLYHVPLIQHVVETSHVYQVPLATD